VKAEILRNGSALILPSINNNEAFGMVLLEALSSGTPVIASDLPGVRNVFTNGLEGYYTAPGNVNDLAEKINFVLSDRVLNTKMGLAARALALKKYDENKVSEQLNTIYNNIYNN
jgi:glycosyltransferase involved in cell wall biosynthesis